MKTRNILVLALLAALAWSCNNNKTCPTYASNDSGPVKTTQVN